MKKLLIAVAVLAVLVAAAPFLVPVSSFIPELARLASEKLGQPVAIADLRIHLLPTPRAVANGIRVGKKDDVTIGELEIVPDLVSLLSGPRTVRLVRAQKVELLESALSIPGKMPKTEPGEPIRVERVELRDVKLHHSAFKLPPFDAAIELAEGFREARVETRDGALQVKAEGTLKGQQLDLPKIDGRLYGGSLAGAARADWAKLWQVSGSAKLNGVDLVPLQQALGRKPKLSGRLKADATFSARAKSADLLANALALDGPFEVKGGAYQGVDLSKAADLTGKPAVGDATRFEQFTGKLQMRGKRVRISELCVRSPVLIAGGAIEIAPDQKLSGKLDVSIAKTGGFVGVPVAVGGTTADPTIRPSTGYTVGAVVGTVLLPGIGTALGASAGSRVEGKAAGCK